MTLNECTYLGDIREGKGNTGEFVLALKKALPQRFDPERDPLFLAIDSSQEPIPFYIEESFLKNKKRLILRFEDVEDAESAAPLAQGSVFLPDHFFGPSSKDNELAGFIGFLLLNADNQEMGTITDVIRYPHHSVFQVETPTQEALIPYSPHLILKVDENSRTIRMEIPEGLIPEQNDESNT